MWDRLSEDVLDPIEQALVSLIVERRRLVLVLRQRSGELLEQLLLFLAELLRGEDLDRNEQVAPSTASRHVGHAAPAHPEGRAGLRAFRDGERLLAVERWNSDWTSECRCRVLQRNLAVQIVAVTLEERMVQDLDDDVEIAARPACQTGLALAREPEPLPGGDAGRNTDGELALF